MSAADAHTTLALCASGESFSLALRAQDGRIDEYVVPGRRQVADLPALLDRLHAASGHAVDELGELRVDRGPGSYTGLRVALTFARVLAAFADLRLRAATSLELMALAAWTNGAAPPDRALRPVLDARRGRAYSARVELLDGRVRLAQAPLALPVAELPDSVRPDETVLLDPAHHAWLPATADLRPPVPYTARDLFASSLPGVAIEVDALEPLYLMGSYAE